MPAWGTTPPPSDPPETAPWASPPETTSPDATPTARKLDGRELATDFRHSETGAPYNPDFAALARSCGVEGVRIDRAGDLGDAIKAAVACGKSYLIDANIVADLNPGGARVWELPRYGVNKPFIGGRYDPPSA
jgi:acetolactate synthase I/II/III large subunit